MRPYSPNLEPRSDNMAKEMWLGSQDVMKVKYKTVHGDVVYQSHLPQHSPHVYVAHSETCTESLTVALVHLSYSIHDKTHGQLEVQKRRQTDKYTTPRGLS
ncbi:unnamed protein product [Fusarium graminearum]|uniref:Uncharacterized protein n=1 Tax=Gibberella zeae TaxID=5518 RepID=A0A9N8RGX9_GIBZA|nr:unnamed protein product [Fusarium graminearum]